jgi:ribA/ribD-fused uncharacterized protein
MTIWNPNYYDNFTFFWSGPFSQWEPSFFTIGGIRYNCAEQYMMAAKAELFNDIVILSQIMKSNSPKEQKALGRQVSGFNETAWNKVARFFVYQGNYAKFTQNPDLLVQLFDTGETLLVEASPYDKVWGIGLTAEQAAITPYIEWPGKNWLGEMLTKVRNNLLLTA